MSPLVFEADRDPACDAHAHCLCGGLMACDEVGDLVCQDCGLVALGPEGTVVPS